MTRPNAKPIDAALSNEEGTRAKVPRSKKPDPHARSVYATSLTDVEILAYIADPARMALLTPEERDDFMAELGRINRKKETARLKNAREKGAQAEDFRRPDQEHPRPAPVPSRADVLPAQPKPPKARIPSWQTVAVVLGLALLVLMMFANRGSRASKVPVPDPAKEAALRLEESRKAEEVAFKAMTPAEHLAKAEQGLKMRTLEGAREADRQLQAVPVDQPGRAKLKTGTDAVLARFAVEEARQEAARRQRDFEGGTARRKAYARSMEEVFLDLGMDVKVTTSGQFSEILNIRYILASRVMARDISQGDILPSARERGFKRVRLTDGYEANWSWTL